TRSIPSPDGGTTGPSFGPCENIFSTCSQPTIEKSAAPPDPSRKFRRWWRCMNIRRSFCWSR
ncbi:hypothetical protein N9158_01930, partial [bacterium]|nr:hypothetical protein [bacterium]